MDNRVKVINLRMPGELVRKIDSCIEKDRMHTTRPDFIIDSLRSLFEWLLSVRIAGNDEDSAELVTSMAMIHMRVVLQTMIDDYESHKGEPVQVVIRIPVGMYDMINSYSDKLRPYDRFSDFLKAAAVYGLHNVPDLKNRLNPDTYVLDPIFDFEQSGCKFETLFATKENAREIVKLYMKKGKK